MLSYHQSTAYDRGGLGGHGLDWGNQPWPFKRYAGLQPRPLPQPALSTAPFWPLALSWPSRPWQQAPALDQAGLAGLLWLAAGLTAQAGQGLHLRAPASAGALYPAELYLFAQGLEYLDDGLWHLAPQSLGLHPLRSGPLAGSLAAALGGSPRGLGFTISAVFWRSLWKYGSRAWRYCLLDAGHLLTNLELACAAAGLQPHLHLEFADDALARLLGLDPEREAPLVGLLAGRTVQAEPLAQEAWQPPEAEPSSPREGGDPAILAACRSGALKAPRPEPVWPQPPVPKEARLLSPRPPEADPGLAAVAAKRRSRRNFLRRGLDAGQAALLLAAALPADAACQARVLLGPGPDLPAGLYQYHPQQRALAALETADPRPGLGPACLGQLWTGAAALSLVFWADLAQMEAAAGPRAYRQAMLAAGRAGQRLYLAATALGLGCCGVGAFFDREVAAAAGLPPGGQPLYVVSCGPVKAGLD
ncbi:MAG: SagB/ThcOx family dehydrogenase [Desulfarculus sp.]|nr:MAG: SagB/ThcOx family dehydrogenase [Desulfarculus sp.]